MEPSSPSTINSTPQAESLEIIEEVRHGSVTTAISKLREAAESGRPWLARSISTDSNVMTILGSKNPAEQRSYSSDTYLHGDSLLHIAARRGSSREDIDEIIELGSDIDWRNAYGEIPADAAYNAGNIDLAEYLFTFESATLGSGPPLLTPLVSAISDFGVTEQEHVSICIGDIHGCFDHLVGLYEKLKSTLTASQWESAYFFWLGDYVDKGPQSREAIEFLSTVQSKSPKEQRHYFIAGNHDLGLIHFLGLYPNDGEERKYLPVPTDRKRPEYTGPGSEVMHRQGLEWGSRSSLSSSQPTFNSYGVALEDRDGFLRAMPEHHKDFFRNLKWHCDVQLPSGHRVITVHAGFLMPRSDESSLDSQLAALERMDLSAVKPDWLHGRKSVIATCPSDLISDPVEAERTFFVSGHHHVLSYVTSADNPEVNTNRIVIDSCAGNVRNSLSAVILPSHNVISYPQEEEPMQLFRTSSGRQRYA